MNVRAERPFISLGSPRGAALTSLDKYIELKKQEKRSSVLVQQFPVDDQNDQIAALQREQSRLCEELTAERRRSESLKATFSRAVTLAAAQQKEKLNAIKRVLQNAQKKSAVTQKALKYILSLENKENAEVPDAPKLSELTQQAKEAELSNEKEQRLNRALKKKLVQVRDEKQAMAQEVETAQQNLDQIVEARRELKEKCKTFVQNVRRKEAQWKERYAALEAELDALR